LRIDKYLWCVRLAKTRSLAAEWISKGKVKINDASIKSSRIVKTGEVISIHKNTAVFQYEVIGIIDKRLGAPLVKDFIRDITKQEEIEKFKEYQQSQRSFQTHQDGKASKRDRRELDDFLNNWI